jgi:predicted nucleic-acid-binding Zn-ribbon protein
MWTCSKCGEQIDDQFDSCWKCATVPGGLSPAIKCFKCGGTELVKGEINVCGKGRQGLLSYNIFEPDTLRFLTFTLTNGTRLETKSYACLGCGTVWSQTDPTALREFIRKHC